MNAELPEELKAIHLVSGIGDPNHGTACVMTLAYQINRIRLGEKGFGLPDDNMSCCCPILRGLAIQINDYGFYEIPDRTAWGLALAPRLIDTRRGIDVILRRMLRVLDVLTRELVPTFLRFDMCHHDLKKQLKSLEPINSEATLKVALEVVRGITRGQLYQLGVSLNYASLALESTDEEYAEDQARNVCANVINVFDENMGWRRMNELIEEFLKEEV